MASNGHARGDENILVLYKVVNSETDPEGDHYNAFHMPGGSSLTLAAVKQHCSALRTLNHIGADGFHWRVCVEDKPVSGSSSTKPMFSWWDIQDERASLPVKNASPSELQRLFTGSSQSSSSSGDNCSTPAATKAAKGAFKSLGKAMNAVAGAVDGGHHDDHGPRVNVIAFKLLDLVKMHDDFVRIHGGSSRGGHVSHHEPAKAAAPRARPAAATPAAPQRQSAPRPQPQQGRTPARTPTQPARAPQTAPRAAPQQQRQPQQDANLMGFDSPSDSRRTVKHAQSMPASFDNESRVEKLKREYAEKNQKQNRVWDEVDERWVEVDVVVGGVKTSASAPPTAANGNSGSGSKTMGIKLDASNAVGKSATVQAAVHKRVNEMRESQEKALQEVREREAKKKQEEEEEDEVRKRLEPKIKAWSEEHGKKKQLRALLGTLHTILWPGANWKPVSLGDLLDDGKVKKCFHKASRVVHPDKTHHLPAEQRFLAKRIFDALSQAKTEFDDGTS